MVSSALLKTVRSETDLALKEATSIADTIAIELTDEDMKQIDRYVDRIVAARPNTPEFFELADMTHMRLHHYAAHTITKDTSNVTLVLALLDSLREHIEYAMPPLEKRPRGWDFTTSYGKVSAQIEWILSELERGRNALEKELKSNDKKVVSYVKGIDQLRRQLRSMAILRERLTAKLTGLTPFMRDHVNEHVVFYISQRELDLVTEITVMTQAYVALKMMRKTAVMLKISVDRVLTNTTQAIRNAIYVTNNIKVKDLDAYFNPSLEYYIDPIGLTNEKDHSAITQMVTGLLAVDSEIKNVDEEIKKLNTSSSTSTLYTVNKVNWKSFVSQEESYDDLFYSDAEMRIRSKSDRTYPDQ